MARLKDKVALISGGARGMGATHARAMIGEGAKVVIGDLLDKEGQAFAKELGPSVRCVHLDVTRPADWDTAVATTTKTYGKLNVLVNNAGITSFGGQGCLHAALRAMSARTAPVIVAETLGACIAYDALDVPDEVLRHHRVIAWIVPERRRVKH